MILLTGCTGFLGSRLLARFLACGEEVVAIKRSFSDTSRIEPCLSDPRLHLCDIDSIEVSSLFQAHAIDTIVHAATQYGRNATPIYSILEANLILPLRLAELGIENGARCFINTDSYFNKNNSSYSNLLDYSLSKKSLLIWLQKLSSQIRIINVVLEHIYGPHDAETKFVESLVRKIAVQQVDHVALTHGHQRRDFVYLDDVVDAYLRLVQHGRDHDFRYKTFEVGTGESTQIRDFAMAVKDISASSTNLRFGEIPYRADEIMSSAADISHLKDLGWLPTTSIESGIRKVLLAYGALRGG